MIEKLVGCALVPCRVQDLRKDDIYRCVDKDAAGPFVLAVGNPYRAAAPKIKSGAKIKKGTGEPSFRIKTTGLCMKSLARREQPLTQSRH